MNEIDKFTIFHNEKISSAAAGLEKLIELSLPPVLVVVDKYDILKGTITDGDIRRYLIRNNNLDDIVLNAMNNTPFSIRTEEEVTKEQLKNLKVVPVIDGLSKVIDIVYISSKSRSTNIANTNVVINAGGLGKRLYPYTKLIPKPLVRVNHIPMIDHVINSFISYGFKNFKVILNHKKEMIINHLNYKGSSINIEFIVEDEPFGTIGGLGLINEITNPFILTNCDILVNHDPTLLLEFHTKNNHDLTVVSSTYENTIPYGVLSINDKGIIESVIEKPSKNHFVSTVLYVINKELLDLIPNKKRLDMDEFIRSLLKSKIPVGIYPIEHQQWSDMGTIEGLLLTERKLSGNSE